MSENQRISEVFISNVNKIIDYQKNNIIPIHPVTLWEWVLPVEWLQYAIDQGMKLVPDSVTHGFNMDKYFSPSLVKTMLKLKGSLEHVDKSERTLMALAPYWFKLGTIDDIYALFTIAGDTKITSAMAVLLMMGSGDTAKLNLLFERCADEREDNETREMVHEYIENDICTFQESSYICDKLYSFEAAKGGFDMAYENFLKSSSARK